MKKSAPRHFAEAAIVFAALLLTAACGDSGTRAQDPPHLSTVFNRGNGAEPKSLDPAYFTELAPAQIVGDLLMGLTTEDADGHAIPGAAERWETSADGLTWTFHVRDHQWSDGQPVTASDFVYAWQRVVDSKNAAPTASYLYLLRNAREVVAGRMPLDALGVVAPDDKTLVVTLASPAPYLPDYLTNHALYPVPHHVVETKSEAWARPGNFVSNGAYVLKEWIPEDHVTLTKNPRFYDASNVAIDAVTYSPTPDADAALKRFRARELDVQDPTPPLEIDFLRANMADALKTEPSLSLSYISINTTKRPFNDIRIREALNLAYDRETMTGKILRLGEQPAHGMVPPGTANYPGGAFLRFKDMAPDARLARAQMLMRQAGYGPAHLLHAKLSTTNNAITRQTLAPIQAMWRAIYVDLDIDQADTAVNYQRLAAGDFELGTGVWVADFDDASNFLDVLRDRAANNYGRYSNKAYDALLDAAAKETNSAKRGAMLAKAEQLMLDDYPLVFARFGVTTALVQPTVKGWIANNKEVNRTRWLSVDPTARGP